MFCDTNWIVVLIRFSTINVPLVLILESVVGLRRIQFIKVSKSGDMRYVEKSPSNSRFDSKLCSLSSWLIWITISHRVHHLALFHIVSLLQLASVVWSISQVYFSGCLVQNKSREDFLQRAL